MLPRRKKKPEAAPETKASDSIIEILQTQINEERTQQARPSSRTQSDRKVITKKKQKPVAPVEPSQPKTQSPPRPKPRYATTETVTEESHTEMSVSAPEIKPLAASGFSYFDRLTERSIFDDPLKDFPELRKHLEPK